MMNPKFYNNLFGSLYNGSGRMERIESHENIPHVVSEVICVKCGKRWISVRPQETLLKDIECPNCGKGFVIETGQILDEG